MSLKYDVTKRAIGNKQHPNSTTKVLRASCRIFSDWAREKGLNKISKIENSDTEAVIQGYADYLVDKGYSPATIHTYLYGPCRAFGVKMQDIRKPKRAASTITRSRDETKNIQGRIEAGKPEYDRLVTLQRALGLRRHELAKLTGGSLTTDESNHICVSVVGKGGKHQLQRILPSDIDTVQQIFAGIKKDEPVFSSTELRNNIDLHGMRAEHARASYEYYHSMTIPEKRELVKEMCARWLACHPGYGKDSYAFRKWYSELWKGHGLYTLRGENYDRAVKAGRETRYDRIALMATSIFSLSHWRLSVCALHYMI